MQERIAFFLLQFFSLCRRIIIYAGHQNNFCAIALCCLNLCQRCACGHTDYGLNALFLCCQSNALCMVAGGTCNHAVFRLFICQVCRFIVRAAQFERTRYLHIFTLDIYISVRVNDIRLEQRRNPCHFAQYFFCILNHIQSQHYSTTPVLMLGTFYVNVPASNTFLL